MIIEATDVELAVTSLAAQKGLGFDEVAKRLDITPKTLQRYLDALEGSTSHLHRLIAIADALDVRLSDLIIRAEDARNHIDNQL